MRNRLRRRFIAICALSYVAVALLVLGGAFAVSTFQTNSMMDELTQLVIDRDGVMPEREQGHDGEHQKSDRTKEDKSSDKSSDKKSDKNFDGGKGFKGKGPDNRSANGFLNGRFFTPETPYNTRFFLVTAQEDGTNAQVSANSLARLSSEEMIQMAQGVIGGGSSSGWVDQWYRFRVAKADDGSVKVAFVDGFIQKSSVSSSMVSIAVMLLIIGALFLVVVVVVSGRAVRPLVSAHERQKQFITDASHELKTPLTLMLTNIDIARLESGPNDWLDDAYSEGRRMGDLLSQMTKMAAMDEEAYSLQRDKLDLSQMVSECVDSFSPVQQQRNLQATCEVDEDVVYSGDETLIRQLVSTLVDNAFRYVNDEGWVRVRLTAEGRGGHPMLTVANSISAETEFDPARVFDRFYRADKSRTAGSGFGIGLSAAQLIAEKHGARIHAEHAPGESVSFFVRF